MPSWRIGPGGPFLVNAQLDGTGPSFQPNQAEHTSRTHELDLFSSTAVSGLLRAIAITTAAVVSVPYVSRAEAAPVEAYPSTLLRAQVPLPAIGLVRPEVLVGEARAVDAYPSLLLRSQAPTIIATNQPKPLRGDAADVVAASGSLLKSSTPLAPTGIQPRKSVVDPQRPDEPDAFSWSQYIIYFDAPLLAPNVADSAPFQFDLPSKLARITPPDATLNPFQPNQAEHQQGTHELHYIESQNRSGLLKAHFEAQAVSVSIPLKPLVAEAEQFQAKPSTLTQPRFEPVLQKVRLASVDPIVPDAYPSTLAKPRFEQILQRVRLASVDPGVSDAYPSALARPRFETVAPLQFVRPSITEPVLPSLYDAGLTSTLSKPRFEPAATQQGLRVLVGEAERTLELASALGALSKPRFEQAIAQQNLRVLTTEPAGASPDWLTTSSKLSAPRFEPPPVIQGINPHVIVAGPQDNFDGMFTSGSTLTIPNHTEPFVPPPVAEAANVFPWWAPQRPGKIITKRKRLETVEETLQRALADLTSPIEPAELIADLATVRALRPRQPDLEDRLATLETKIADYQRRKRRYRAAFLLLT